MVKGDQIIQVLCAFHLHVHVGNSNIKLLI